MLSTLGCREWDTYADLLRTLIFVDCVMADLRRCATQVEAASAVREAAAAASATQEKLQEGDVAIASLRSRLDQKGAELASAMSSAQESAKVPVIPISGRLLYIFSHGNASLQALDSEVHKQLKRCW